MTLLSSGLRAAPWIVRDCLLAHESLSPDASALVVQYSIKDARRPRHVLYFLLSPLEGFSVPYGSHSADFALCV